MLYHLWNINEKSFLITEDIPHNSSVKIRNLNGKFTVNGRVTRNNLFASDETMRIIKHRS